MDNDFIEPFEAALDATTCARIVERFRRSDKASPGLTGSGLDKTLKDSWDLCLEDHTEWSDVSNVLNAAMMQALIRYVRAYPFTVLAPLALRMADPTSAQTVLLDPEKIRAMPDDLLQSLLVKVFRPGTINLQRYEAGTGGYPYWHSEQYPKQGDVGGETLHRVLLWMVYLNDDFSAGETEFYHQKRKIQPRTGALLIAPAAFTHTHRGNRPVGGDKFIATSWVLFQRAERLFGSV